MTLSNANRSYLVIVRETGEEIRQVVFPSDVTEVSIVRDFNARGYDILTFNSTDTPDDPKHLATIELKVRRRK